MQKTCTLCHTNVHADLGCKKSAELSDLDRMFQCVLSITGTEFHLSKQFHELRMDSMDSNFERSGLTVLTHVRLHFALCFLHHLLDSCRMNTSIHNQAFQSNPCHLTADRIKTRKNNCLRGIIDDQLYASQGL